MYGSEWDTLNINGYLSVIDASWRQAQQATAEYSFIHSMDVKKISSMIHSYKIAIIAPWSNLILWIIVRRVATCQSY